MKKILILLVMTGVMMLLSGFVFADDTLQGGQVHVNPDLTLDPEPDTLNFGSMIPGHENTLQSSLKAGTSHVVISMTKVTPTDQGGVFNEINVMFSTDNQNFVSAEVFNSIFIIPMNTFDFFVKLTLPVGTPSGSFTGTITYTVMEDIPPPGPGP